MTEKMRGFTLVELIVVITILGVLVSIASPFYADWSRAAQYREAARAAASVLRAARSEAIHDNKAIQVSFTLDSSSANDGNQYSMLKNGAAVPQYQNVPFPVGIEIRRSPVSSDTCNTLSGAFTITLNPDGTADTSNGSDICVMDSKGNKLFRTVVVSSTTGSVDVQKWNGSAWE
jgi:prepilin-type N-terminal cleavage/methylation domain-containing protein